MQFKLGFVAQKKKIGESIQHDCVAVTLFNEKIEVHVISQVKYLVKP